MPSINSENPKRGRDFENKVAQVLKKKYKTNFNPKSIKIGKPPKAHVFDLVSEGGDVIVECKNYSWTETGNIPAAKMAVLNEAVLYLSHAPKSKKKNCLFSLKQHQNIPNDNAPATSSSTHKAYCGEMIGFSEYSEKYY